MPHGGSIPHTTTLAEREAARGVSPLAGVRHPMADEKAGFSMLGDRVAPTRPVPQEVAKTIPEQAPAAPKKVRRNMQGLVEALFDEIDAMRDGTGSPERLKAICGVAASISGLLNTEIKFRKMADKDEGFADRIKVITG